MRPDCNDQKMYPVRGQTSLVSGDAKAIRTRHGIDEAGKNCISYVIGSQFLASSSVVVSTTIQIMIDGG